MENIARTRNKNVGGHARPNFTWHELSCKCGCGTSYMTPRSLNRLQAVRDIVGVPMTITSAARCPLHNAFVGGAPMSFHRSTPMKPACAFDVAVTDNLTKDMLLAAVQLVGFKGLGINYNTFVHFDDRGYRARW